MTDEIQDGFTRLKELALNISENISAQKLSLAQAQSKKLLNDIDVLEAEIEYNS